MNTIKQVWSWIGGAYIIVYMALKNVLIAVDRGNPHVPIPVTVLTMSIWFGGMVVFELLHWLKDKRISRSPLKEVAFE